MRTTIERDDARVMDGFAKNHDVVAGLNDLQVWLHPHGPHRRREDAQDALGPQGQVFRVIGWMQLSRLGARIGAPFPLWSQWRNLAVWGIDDEGRAPARHDRAGFIPRVGYFARRLPRDR